MVKTKTVQSVAEEMLENLECKKRTDGKNYICNIKEVEWQKDIIHKAHGNKLPDDYVYEFIYDALNAITEAEEGNEEEAICGLEADCYTSNLTEWLNSRNDRVYYITEALEQFDIKDGFSLLSQAYSLEQQEVAQAVLQGIKEYIKLY